DVLANFAERGIRNTRRIGSHVSDQTDRTLVTEFNALVKFLGHHHRPLHCKAEFARGFLLEFRRDEWWNWIAFSFLGGDVVDYERLLLCFGDNVVSLCLIFDEDLVLLEILIEATRLNRLFIDLEQT